MKRLFVLLLVFVCSSAVSQIYKRVGPDGQVYFSDTPSPGAEKIRVAPAQAVSMPAVPEPVVTTEPAEDAADQLDTSAADYSDFSISSPANDESVRANNGNVNIVLDLEPGLLPGHKILLSINGEDGVSNISGTGMVIGLTNMSRGQHTVQASVMDATGNVLIQTDPVTFYVQRVALGGG